MKKHKKKIFCWYYNKYQQNKNNTNKIKMFLFFKIYNLEILQIYTNREADSLEKNKQ